MKQKVKVVTSGDYPELTVSANPPKILDIVRTGNAGILETQDVNVFYALADYAEKTLKTLKEQCRNVIVGRREEGKPSGDQLQHREFSYELPNGSVHLTIQERILQRPNLEKLETLLRYKDLWDSAVTTTVDMNKVTALCEVGLITPQEFDSISDAPKPSYAVIARFNAVAKQPVLK